jgi:hypothetical protein
LFAMLLIAKTFSFSCTCIHFTSIHIHKLRCVTWENLLFMYGRKNNNKYSSVFFGVDDKHQDIQNMCNVYDILVCIMYMSAR